MSTSLDTIIEEFVALRDKKATMKRVFDEHVAPINERMEKLENALLHVLNRTGSENIRTKHGTAYKAEVFSVSVEDWDLFLEHVRDNDAFHLLNHSANKTASRDFLEETKAPPPGVNVTSMIQARVKRA